jgi:hypothetical protein
MNRPASAAPIVAVLVVAACAGAAQAAEHSGVKGRVFDVTCRGPCAPEIDPEPYAGEAGIAVRRRGGTYWVAATVEDGRFRAALRPARYRLVAQIDDPCWESQAAKVRVKPGKFKRKRLYVTNVCVR